MQYSVGGGVILYDIGGGAKLYHAILERPPTIVNLSLALLKISLLLYISAVTQFISYYFLIDFKRSALTPSLAKIFT